jgi:hypothetical protein
MRGNTQRNLTENHLAMLGHELRNALNGVVGVTELLGATSLSGEQQQLLEALQQSGTQLRWLIDSVSSEDRKPNFPFEALPYKLNGIDLLEQAVRCHTPAAIQSNNLLLLKIEPELPADWKSDGRLLRQLIDNLLSNAIRATHSGSIVLEARRTGGSLQKDDGLELLVRDTGPGISPESRRRIFEPWVQLSDKQNKDSAGLGLHICTRIVSSLRGTVDCLVGSGSGSCFRVYLPGIFFDSPLPEKNGLVSRLFSSMNCLVPTEEPLHSSLESILSRLGVRTVSREKVMESEPGSKVQIIIRELEIPGRGKNPRPGLLLGFHPGHNHGENFLHSRRLSAPYLESTLGPLLMEMALEWRIYRQKAE